jgi:hypothetical protein
MVNLFLTAYRAAVGMQQATYLDFIQNTCYNCSPGLNNHGETRLRVVNDALNSLNERGWRGPFNQFKNDLIGINNNNQFLLQDVKGPVALEGSNLLQLDTSHVALIVPSPEHIHHHVPYKSNMHILEFTAPNPNLVEIITSGKHYIQNSVLPQLVDTLGEKFPLTTLKKDAVDSESWISWKEEQGAYERARISLDKLVEKLNILLGDLGQKFQAIDSEFDFNNYLEILNKVGPLTPQDQLIIDRAMDILNIIVG